MFQELRHFKLIATPIPEERIRQRPRRLLRPRSASSTSTSARSGRRSKRRVSSRNTVFIYTSDHGEALGEHGLWLKNNLLEPAAHVPLVVAGPGIPRGRTVDHAVSHMDLVQSLLEWGGADAGFELRGKSLIRS